MDYVRANQDNEKYKHLENNIYADSTIEEIIADIEWWGVDPYYYENWRQAIEELKERLNLI